MSTVVSPTPSPSITVRELSGDADRAAWDAFAGACPEGDVLQSWEWAAVKKADMAPLRIAAFRDGAIAGGAAILRYSLPLVGPYYYAPRGPLLADWADEAVLVELLSAIRERARRDGAMFLKIDPAVPVEREDVAKLLAKHGCRPPVGTDAQGFGGTQPRCVMVLDVGGRTEQELLAGFKPQTRRNIKLSTEKHGVEVVEDVTRGNLVAFDALMKVTGERDGFKPYNLAYFQSIWDNLGNAGMAKLFLTRYEGEYLSGAICFLIGDKAWYVFGASSNENRNVMPNYAMQWAMIRWALRSGCSTYDFRGVSPRRRVEGESAEEVEKEDHLQGLNRFKEGFGSRYVEYIGELHLVYKPAAYWLFTNGKSAVQGIRRKLLSKP